MIFSEISYFPQTTYAYSTQLLETYGKLCEADGKKLPRNVSLSKNRLVRVWPRLELRLREFRERTEAAESVYTLCDLLLTRVQEYLLELNRSPLTFERNGDSPTSPTTAVPNEQHRGQLETLMNEFQNTKTLGLALIDRLPKGLLADDPIFVGPVIEEVSRLIRMKLYTLWLKLREYEYAIMGYNLNDHTTATELGLDTIRPVIRSKSTSSTNRRAGWYSKTNAFTNGSTDLFHSTEPMKSPLRAKSVSSTSATVAAPVHTERSVEVLDEKRSLSGSPLFTPVRAETIPGAAQGRPKNLDTFDAPNEIVQRMKMDYNERPDFRWTGHRRSEPSDTIRALYIVARNYVEYEYAIMGYNLNDHTTATELGLDTIRPVIRSKSTSSTNRRAGSSFDGVDEFARTPFLPQTHRDPIFVGPVIEEVSRLIRMKLYTLWLKLREYEYAIMGYNLNDHTTATELGLDTIRPVIRSKSTSSTNRRAGSSFDGVDEFARTPFLPSNSSVYSKTKHSLTNGSTDLFHSTEPMKSPLRAKSVSSTSATVAAPVHTERSVEVLDEKRSLSGSPLFTPVRAETIPGAAQGRPKNLDTFDAPNEIVQRMKMDYNEFEAKLTSAKPRGGRLNSEAQRQTLRRETDRELSRLENRINDHLSKARDPNSAFLKEVAGGIRENAKRFYTQWLRECNSWEIRPESSTSNDAFHTRLRDLETDLGECQGRLCDLISAACMTTAENSKLTDSQLGNWSSYNVTQEIVTKDDIDRIGMIYEETKGMSETVPMDGHCLEREIAQLVKPSTILSSAREVARLSESTPVVEWLVQLFKIRLKDVTDAVDELDMLTSNFRTDSSLENVDLAALLPNSPTESARNTLGSSRQRSTLESSIQKTTPRTSSGIPTRVTSSNDDRTPTPPVVLDIPPPLPPRSNFTYPPVREITKDPIIRSTSAQAVGRSAAEQTTLAPWRITQPLSDVEVKADERVILRLRWSRLGTMLDAAQWHVTNDRNTSSVFSNTANLADEGLYECHLQDPQSGFELRSAANLLIDKLRHPKINSPLLIGDSEKDGKAHVGEKLIIRCPLPKPVPKSDCTIDWLHNGRTIYTFQPSAPTPTGISMLTVVFGRTNTRENTFQNGQTTWRTYVADRSCVLTTNVAHHADQGEYTCRIYMSGDVYESTGTVTVCEKLEFVEELQNVCVQTGQPISLQCRLNRSTENTELPDRDRLMDEKSDTMKIRWYLDGQLLNPYKCVRLGITTQATENLLSLFIPSATVEYVGMYRCEVELNNTLAQTQCHVTVQASQPPKVLRRISNPSGPLVAGQDLSITVYFQADPMPCCVWTKDDGPLDYNTLQYEETVYADRCQLVLKNLQPKHTGLYRVRLDNGLGADETSEFINVVGLNRAEHELKPAPLTATIVPKTPDPPSELSTLSPRESLTDDSGTFLLHPSSATVIPGDTVKFLCILKPQAEPHSVVWSRDGNVLTSGAGYRMYNDYPRDGVYQLEIERVSAKQAAREPGKQWRNPIFRLHVESSDLTKNTTPRSAPYMVDQGLCPFVSTDVGEKIVLSCEVHGNPKPRFCWIKDTQIIVEPKNPTVLVTGEDSQYQLTISNAQPEHAGLWELICYNSHGFILSACKVDIALSKVQQLTGEQSLSSATPYTTEAIDLNKTAAISLPLLVRTPAVMSFSTSTEKRNDRRRTSNASATTTEVTKPPEFRRVFTDVACRIGETVRLKCHVTGCPTPLVRWTFNGRPVDPLHDHCRFARHGDEYALVIQQACVTNSGRYSLTAENIVGIATCSALLFVSANHASRPSSSLSEPGFYNYTRGTVEVGGINVTDGRTRRSSGTQTPINQRVALIRLIRYLKSPRLTEYAFKIELLPTIVHTVRRRRGVHGRIRRSQSSASSPRIVRTRSENSLVHLCPQCRSVMRPKSCEMNPDMNCIRSTYVSERVYTCGPTQVESARLFSSSHQKRVHTNPDSSVAHRVHSGGNYSPRSPSHGAASEREIPVRLIGAMSSQTPMDRHECRIQLVHDHVPSVNRVRTRVISSSSKPSDEPESHFSTVESSDGDVKEE
ncbi:hypothetical protein AHF37_02316 [Paragonimus kellicotti]|nr:hypothetical protein AHF37_02316 [Paragonimus kellicotti]